MPPVPPPPVSTPMYIFGIPIAQYTLSYTVNFDINIRGVALTVHIYKNNQVSNHQPIILQIILCLHTPHDIIRTKMLDSDA